MLLSVNLLKNHSFTINPEQVPDSFAWSVEKPGEDGTIVSIPEWNKVIQEEYEKGWLRPIPLYYLSPTNRSGEYVNTFGTGSALTALPIYALLNLFTDISTSRAWWWRGAKLTASVLVASTVLLIFLTMSRFVSVPAAALGALSFGLGSNAWSVSSQTLWQHPSFSFFLALAAWLLVVPPGQEKRNAPLYFGAALGMATLCRSTGALFVICVGIYLLLVSYSQLARPREESRRAPLLRAPLTQYVIGGLPFAVLFVLYNFHYFDSPFALAQERVSSQLAAYKIGTVGAWQTDLLEGLGGLLFSPSRGLLVYSPIFLAGFAGAVVTWRSPRSFGSLAALQISALAVFGMTAAWYDWWGGWSYGPRLLTDLGVILALSMIPVMAGIMARPLLLSLFLTLLLYSGLVQAVGAWTYNASAWNDRNGEDIDRPEHRHRLWSFSDSQIKYYLEHFGEARNDKRQAISLEFDRRIPILVPSRSSQSNS